MGCCTSRSKQFLHATFIDIHEQVEALQCMVYQNNHDPQHTKNIHQELSKLQQNLYNLKYVVCEHIGCYHKDIDRLIQSNMQLENELKKSRLYVSCTYLT